MISARRITTVTVTLLLGLHFSAYAAPCTPAPADLVSWWTGNGNAFDQTGDNHLIPHGGIVYTSAIVGSGFMFNGTNAYLSAPDHSSLNFTAGEDFSFALWLRVDAGSPAVQAVLDKRVFAGGCAQGYFLYLDAGRPVFQMDDPSGCSDFASSGPDLRDGTFHFVAITVDRDALGGGRIYVDGTAVLTFEPSQRPGDLSNDSALSFGHYALTGPHYFFTGTMDEIDLYGRALSPSELAGLQEAGSGGKCLPAFYFAGDQNMTDLPPTPPDDPLRPESLPNSRSEQARFMSRIPSVSGQSFESTPLGPLSLFTSGTAIVTVQGAVDVRSQPTGTYDGAFPTQGDRFLFQFNNGSSFTLQFSAPQAAFGFMGTDMGDGGTQLLLDILRVDGTRLHVAVPHATSTPGAFPNLSGSALFFGFIDTENEVTAVTFINPNSSLDGFGFDEFVIARAIDVTAVIGGQSTTRVPRVFPNPSGGPIQFAVPGENDLRIQVFDLQGREVWSAVGRTSSITWSGLDQSGRHVPAAVYLARFSSAGHRSEKKFVKLR